MNFFYFDQTNQKFGPVSEQQLRELAMQGIIGQHTPLETDTGYKGLAGQIPGLFPDSPPSPFSNSAMIPVAEQLFCTNCGSPVLQRAIACTSCGAKPIGHRKFCRQCGSGLNPHQVICIKCGSGLANLSGDGLPTVASLPLSKTLNTYFNVFWICYVAGLPLSFLLIGIPAVIVGMIYQFMLLHALWKLIPPDIARTTPGKAVGFCFIPFFNFYWIFVAYRGLGNDLNKLLLQRGNPYKVNEDLGGVFCILAVAGLIPYVGFITGIPALIVWIFFLKSVKNGAIALLEQEE